MTIAQFPTPAQREALRMEQMRAACADWQIVTDPKMPPNSRIQACDRLLRRTGLRDAFVAQVQSERQRLARQAARNVRAAMLPGETA